jgi:hypothetical protein
MAWKKIAIPVTLLTGVVTIFLGIQHANYSRLSSELRALETEFESTQREMAHLEEYNVKWRQIQNWKSTQHSWGQELVQIAKQSARFESSYLNRVQFESPDSDQPPSIRLEGRSKTVGDAISWNRFETTSASRYSLVPQTIESTVADPDFPIQFRTEATLPQSNTEEDTE